MAKEITKIFLDLDGVIRDFDSGCFKHFNVEPFEIKGWDHLDTKICKELGISKSYFWQVMDEEYWLGLDFMPWADEILSLLPYESTCILTSPTLTSAGSNQAWIMQNMPKFFYDKKYLIGPAKQFCANKDALLIDDADHNVESFLDAGGNAILFPATWNMNKDEVENRMEYFKDELKLYNI